MKEILSTTWQVFKGHKSGVQAFTILPAIIAVDYFKNGNPPSMVFSSMSALAIGLVITDVINILGKNAKN